MRDRDHRIPAGRGANGHDAQGDLQEHKSEQEENGQGTAPDGAQHHIFRAADLVPYHKFPGSVPVQDIILAIFRDRDNALHLYGKSTARRGGISTNYGRS